MNFHSSAANDAAHNGPLFVVLNAASGSSDADHEQAVMARVFAEAGREVEFLQITKPADISKIAAHAVELAKERHGVVVAAGGDGTINAVASAVLGSGCPFGVLPQGTFNYFGRAHAIPQDTEAAARALLGASISPVQVGLVNGQPCPTRYEPEGGAYFQRGMSLSREWMRRSEWVDHHKDGDQYGRIAAYHNWTNRGISQRQSSGRVFSAQRGRRALRAHQPGTQAV